MGGMSVLLAVLGIGLVAITLWDALEAIILPRTGDEHF